MKTMNRNLASHNPKNATEHIIMQWGSFCKWVGWDFLGLGGFTALLFECTVGVLPTLCTEKLSLSQKATPSDRARPTAKQRSSHRGTTLQPLNATPSNPLDPPLYTV